MPSLLDRYLDGAYGDVRREMGTRPVPPELLDEVDAVARETMLAIEELVGALPPSARA